MRADVTRAAGWRGLFGRGRHRRGLISRLSSYRGLGVTARGYVFFFPHFLRFCFIDPRYSIATADTRRCLFSSRHLIPPPSRRASIYLSNRTWSVAKCVKCSTSDAPYLRDRENPETLLARGFYVILAQSTLNNSTCPGNKVVCEKNSS